MEANEIASFVAFAEDHRSRIAHVNGDVQNPNADKYAQVSEPGHTSIYPFMFTIVQKSCPVFLCPFLQDKVHRMFVNYIVGGTSAHRDSYNMLAKVHVQNTLTVVVHVSDAIDPNPVRVHIPVYDASIEVSSGHSYVMPGAYLQHKTEYVPTEGVNRYSIVCFLKLRKEVHGVSVNDVIAEYYK